MQRGQGIQLNHGCTPHTELSASPLKCKHPTPTLEQDPSHPLPHPCHLNPHHPHSPSPPSPDPALALEAPPFVARLISQSLGLYSAPDFAEPSLPQELCACVLRLLRATVEKTVRRAGIVASEPGHLQFSLLSAALSASQWGQCCMRSLHDEKTAFFLSRRQPLVSRVSPMGKQ